MSAAVSDRMAAQVAAWDAAADGRAVFLDCYRHMTDAVVERCAGGDFVDGDWVLGLLDRFAEYYFVSIDGGPDAVRVPEPWVIAHAAAVGNDASTLQLLLAGVNAHINYDLVLTLVDVLDDEWSRADAGLRDARRADYDTINTVIAETADIVQDGVVERRAPWMALLDSSFGRWDERVVVRLLSRWRTQVWRHAEEMLSHADPAERARVADRIEQQCVRRARWLLL